MKLSTQFFILIGLLHIALAVTIFLLLGEDKVYFFLAEITLIITFLYSIKIYRRFMHPLKLIQSGTDAIKDQDFNITYTPTGAKEMDQLVKVFNQMIHKIRAERVSLKEQHFFLNKLIEASPNGIVVFDFDGKVTILNPFARKLFGIEKINEQISLEAIDHPIAQTIIKLESGKQTIVKLNGWQQFRCAASHIIHQGFKRKFVIIENLSNELLQSEKEAYGKIIRMMAHEVNNSIGAINSILHTVSDIHSELDFEQKQDANDALAVSIQRNEMLGQFMKNFAEVVRLPKPNKAELDLNELSQAMITLFTPQLEANGIEIKGQFTDKPEIVLADSGQLEQVFVNILKNAMESIQSNGVIEIHVEHKGILKIRDNGTGILPEIKDKLFQPFYSSKPQGQGVGLTLIKEILHQHNAVFSLQTHTDGWTEFKIEF